MRVIAGEARGRPLRAPPGRGTRPTSDRVKGAIFNALGPAAVVPVVLDLFAGSGALGIEALSRGAGHCLFVERDPAAARVIEDNLRRTGLGARGRVLRQDVFAALPNMTAAGALPGAVGLVLADPPYGCGLAARVLGLLGDWPLLAPAARVAIEHGAGERLDERAGRLRLQRRYVHGDTAVSLYRADGEVRDDQDGALPG